MPDTPRTFTLADLPRHGDIIHVDGVDLVVNEISTADRMPERRQEIVLPWARETERRIVLFTVRAMERLATDDEAQAWQDERRNRLVTEIEGQL